MRMLRWPRGRRAKSSPVSSSSRQPYELGEPSNSQSPGGQLEKALQSSVYSSRNMPWFRVEAAPWRGRKSAEGQLLNALIAWANQPLPVALIADAMEARVG